MSLTGSDSGGTKKELTESYYLDTSHPLTSRKLDEFLEEACLKNDDRYMTWVNPYEKMSHKEFYTKAMVLAKGLLAIGMKRGDTFCSFGSQGSDPVLLLIACASLGIKYTANYLYAPIENVIRMMITRIKPNAVLVGNCTSGKRQELACAEFIKVIEDISKTHPHGIEHIIYDRKAANDPLCNIQDDWTSLASIYELGEKISDEVLREAKEKVVQAEPIIYLCSSGSTGEPKIVLLNARNMANAAFHGQQRNSNYGAVTFGVNDIMEGDVKLILVTFSCLATGNNAVIYPATNTPDDLAAITEILAATEKYKIQLMIHRADYVVKIANNLSYKDQYDLKSLSALVIGGYLSSPELKQKLAAFAPYSMDGYGGTEFLNSIDPAPISLLPPEKINTVGKPATNVEMKIVNESGEIVPVNEKGELYVKGWPLFIEYKDQPELTAKAMSEDGWYKTGDMVSMDKDGYLYHFGRLSNAERWKINSRVVYSISMESVLMTHPHVRFSMVIGTDNGKGHDLNYVIEPAPDSTLTFEEIKKFSVEKMYNSQEWPTRIFFYSYDDMPKTAGSRPKVHRKAMTEVIAKRVQADPSDGATNL